MQPRASSCLAVACAASLGLGAAGARASESGAGNAAGPAQLAASALTREPRVLIVQGPAHDWVRRVQGQLSDLPASIETAAAAPQVDVVLSRDELRRRLERLAEQRGAALVASIVRVDTAAGERTQVAIWFSESELFYTRVLAEDWERLSAADRSGALEFAALSVRSAVRALTLDPAEIEAFTEPTLEPSAAANAATIEPAAAAPSAAATSVAEADPLVDPSVVVERVVVEPSGVSAPDSVADTPSASATSTPLELRWNTELSLVGQLQGEPALGSAALQAGIGVASGAWGLSALGQLGIPSSSELGPAQLELQRYALFAELDYAAWNTGAWQLGPLLRAGLTLARRETLPGDAAFAAARSTSQRSFALALGWLTEYRVSPRIGFFGRAALQWQASPPSYAVLTTAGEPVVSAEPWGIQPSVELGGNWHW